MMTITINFDSSIADQALRTVISGLSGPEAIELNRIAGEAARNYAVEYHIGFDERGGWRGKRYMGPGERSGAFGARVAQGWILGNVLQNGATLVNNAEHLAFKVSGGTITPKRARSLTIPKVPEARGLLARDYVRITGRKLFTIKGKDALFERRENVFAGSRGRRQQAGATQIRGSGVRAIYALRQSVTMQPWPNALPSEEKLTETFVRAYSDGLTQKLEQ